MTATVAAAIASGGEFMRSPAGLCKFCKTLKTAVAREQSPPALAADIQADFIALSLAHAMRLSPRALRPL